MNRITLTLLFALPLIPIACVSKRSEVAANLGYEKSSKVHAGPFQLHYGQSGSEKLLLLAEGNWNILSRDTEQGTDVYLKGVPFINFKQNRDGSLTNLSMNVLDLHGERRMTLIDRDADGQWDLKIDHVLKKSFAWKNGQWTER